MDSRTKYSLIIGVSLIWTALCGYCLFSGFYEFYEMFYTQAPAAKHVLRRDFGAQRVEMWVLRWAIGLVLLLIPLVRIKKDQIKTV